MAKTWANMTAAELGAEIGRGRINPVELCEMQLDAIDRHPMRDRIYARVMPNRSRAEAMAAAARAKAGLRRGVLDGVPVSWKDLFDTAGRQTEAGSALLAGRVPLADAEVLRAATLQGLVCLGKTHMSELAFSGLGLNPVTATPPCINDESAVAGGSSSGAAASVAYGLAPAAIGSDTGGSVRIPAAWNDLVGLKTTHGRLSLRGVVPLCEQFDTVGPLAHTVEDCALLLAALEGGRAADLGGAGLGGAGLGGARLLVLETVALDDLRDRPARGFDDALARLARAGARIERGVVPEVAEAMALTAVLFTSEAYGIWGKVIEAAPQKMFPRILERFRAGAGFAAADYVAAWRRLRELRAVWAQAVAGYDAVLVPTAPILPPDAARLLDDDAYYVTENLLALRNTRIGNLMGGCALTLPTSEPSCGISLMAGPMQEERLLRLGAAAERALR
ncbi:amidase [Pseudotabrizicola algicola]|uniref:Amidase n=1 Tax=Pseudotabrizicola algicola TaxID=2709381 RepID=A0A6B3RJ24_9RHOB|nr:amidase family protein [Pseudotabrizicola algicola]NEX46044.1 amidase [Pseudotabrizicola algicola]